MAWRGNHKDLKNILTHSILFWHKLFFWPTLKFGPTPISWTHATHAKILSTPPTPFFWSTPKFYGPTRPTLFFWPTSKFYKPTPPTPKFDPRTHATTLPTPPTLFSRLCSCQLIFTRQKWFHKKLIHYILLDYFYTPWKHQKPRVFGKRLVAWNGLTMQSNYSNYSIYYYQSALTL